MKKTLHKTFIALIFAVGLSFLMGSCGPTYVRTSRSVVYRPAPTRVVVTPVPVVVVPRYCPPPRRGYYGRGYGRGRRW